MIRAISIMQPWAWLIVNGYKDVESCGWLTCHRGATIIHASEQLDKWGIAWVQKYFNIPLPSLANLHELSGGIVGVANLVDCVRMHASPWFFGQYGFVFANARATRFIKKPGDIGMFFVDLSDDEYENLLLDIRS